METLFVAAVFVYVIVCGAVMMLVANMEPEGSNAQTVDVHESPLLEAPAH
jgi:hypothetical protein